MHGLFATRTTDYEDEYMIYGVDLPEQSNKLLIPPLFT